MAERNIDDEWEPDPETDWKPPTEAEMKVLQAKRERADKISKLMGDYLLKGYKMLGTSCSKCMTILLRNREGVDYCVACNELDSDAVKDDPALSREAARKQAAEQQQRDSPVSECAEPDSTLASCTTVLVPSMTPRTSTITQSGGTECMRIEDSDDQCFHSVSDLPPTEMRPSVLPEGGSSSRPEGTFHREYHRNPVVVTLNSDGTFGTTNHLQHGLSSSATTQMQHGRVSSADRQLQHNVQQTIQAVQEKMKWATSELVGSRGVEYSIQVCQLIKTCADTLASLKLVENNNNNSLQPGSIQNHRDYFDTSEE